MPNRVDAAESRPAPAPSDVQNRAQQASEPEPQEQAQQVDRVEISGQARLRAEEARPQAGENPRAAAVDAPSANPPQPGVQGAVNGATEQQVEQLKEAQIQTTRENAQDPPERQGNLVDVVG